MIFVDKLNFSSLLIIICSGEKKIHVLSKTSSYVGLVIKFMSLFNYNFINESFFYGDIISSSGESLYLKTRKSASELSFKYSEFVLNRLEENNYILPEIDKPIIQSFISKRVFIELEFFLRRIDYIKSKKYFKKKIRLIIHQPKLIDNQFIQKNSFIKLEFIGSNFFSILKQEIKTFFIKSYSIFNYLLLNKKVVDHPTTLSIATDPIDSESLERHFPHWVNKKTFNHFVIINDTNQPVNISKEFISKNNITILDKSSLMYLPKLNNSLNMSSIGLKKLLTIQIKKLVLLSNGMLSLLNKYRCEKFIFTEPQDFTTDAVLLCKKNHKIKTYCIQMSSLGFRTPLMISPVDNYLSFSSLYDNIFMFNKENPKKIIPCGYTYTNKSSDKFMISIKEELKSLGVKKIICYFDESIQYDKWGLISFRSAKSEYEDLAKFILKNKDYAVITKPQFIFNSLEIFKSSIISNAVQTKRLIEIKKGKHRNLITPKQVGSISDIAISNLVGGTAGIEAAYSGASLFFINPSNYKPDYYHIIKKKKLIFDNLDTALKQSLDDVKFKNLTKELLNKLISTENKISEILQ